MDGGESSLVLLEATTHVLHSFAMHSPAVTIITSGEVGSAASVEASIRIHSANGHDSELMSLTDADSPALETHEGQRLFLRKPLLLQNQGPPAAMTVRIDRSTPTPWRLQRMVLGSNSASPTACLLRGYGRAGTKNDRIAVNLL